MAVFLRLTLVKAEVKGSFPAPPVNNQQGFLCCDAVGTRRLWSVAFKVKREVCERNPHRQKWRILMDWCEAQQQPIEKDCRTRMDACLDEFSCSCEDSQHVHRRSAADDDHKHQRRGIYWNRWLYSQVAKPTNILSVLLLPQAEAMVSPHIEAQGLEISFVQWSCVFMTLIYAEKQTKSRVDCWVCWSNGRQQAHFFNNDESAALL